ncbi:hypothetical protein ACFVXK_31170, partial [Streptomyces sp. NPDC058157]
MTTAARPRTVRRLRPGVAVTPLRAALHLRGRGGSLTLEGSEALPALWRLLEEPLREGGLEDLLDGIEPGSALRRALDTLLRQLAEHDLLTTEDVAPGPVGQWLAESGGRPAALSAARAEVLAGDPDAPLARAAGRALADGGLPVTYTADPDLPGDRVLLRAHGAGPDRAVAAGRSGTGGYATAPGSPAQARSDARALEARLAATGDFGPAEGSGSARGAGGAGEVGPAGAAGGFRAAGEVGTAGPAGPAGDFGAAGEVGIAGPARDFGAAGEVGIAGPAGGSGSAGEVGIAGPAGGSGSAGDAGTAGGSWAVRGAGGAGGSGVAAFLSLLAGAAAHRLLCAVAGLADPAAEGGDERLLGGLPAVLLADARPLRADYRTWLGPERLDPDRRTGLAPARTLGEALRRLDALADGRCGILPGPDPADLGQLPVPLAACALPG